MVISDRLQAFTNGALSKLAAAYRFPTYYLEYHCSQFRCIWTGWDVWILLMAYRKYLALIWTKTSGIRSSQRICLSSGEDGIFHLVHGSRIIYCILFQCQDCVRRLINSQEEKWGNQASRALSAVIPAAVCMDCYRCLARCRKLLCALGHLPRYFNRIKCDCLKFQYRNCASSLHMDTECFQL